jgi:50S ribosomal subunit-associated GTPase HflX
LELDIPAGKAKKRIVMTDSSGFADGIPEEEVVRKAVAQTLLQIRQAALVLHMLDAANPGSIAEVDRQVARFAETRGGYLILANKVDLPSAKDGLERIRTAFAGQVVLPISALQKKGFKEVRAIVARSL